jgi:hypothetical protein
VNPLDLLGINDYMISHARKKRLNDEDRNDEGYIEENLDSDYTKGLVNKVIGNVSDMEFKKKRRRLPRKRL